MIESVNKMLERKYLADESGYRRIEVKIVSIEESDEDLHLTQASKFDRDPVLIEALFKRGEERGSDFYHEHSQRQVVIARVEAQPPSR